MRKTHLNLFFLVRGYQMNYIPANATSSPRACSIVWIAQRPPEPQTRVQIPAGPLFLVAIRATIRGSNAPRLTSEIVALIAKLLSLCRTVALSNAFKGATPHFKPQHVKRDVAEGKQSNLRYVARFTIDDERELRAACGSMGIDRALAVLSEKRAWLSFF